MTNTQTLSPEDQALLEKPFRVDEHGFLQGKPYIKKSAIRRRLSAVDPGWSQAEPAFVTRDGDVVFYSLSLTVRGVTRSNLGSGIVQTSKTNKDTGEITEYTGFELARNVAKAHKQAASDGLPRAAETFNVGAYLKEIPPGVKVSTPEALKAYLDKVTPPPAEAAAVIEIALQDMTMRLSGSAAERVLARVMERLA